MLQKLFLWWYYYLCNEFSFHVWLIQQEYHFYAFAQKDVHFELIVVVLLPVNFLQYRWAVGKFNNRYYCRSSRYSINFSTEKFLIFLKPISFYFFYIFSLAIVSVPSPLKYILNSETICKKSVFQSTPVSSLAKICRFIYFIWFFIERSILSGDIETNPGLKPKSYQSFSICYWNLNSIAIHNFVEVSLLKSYDSIYNFDILCLSDSSMVSDYKNLEISSYDNLVRVDYLSNSKRGCLFVHYLFTYYLCTW